MTGRRVLRYDSSQKEAESPLRAKRQTCSSKSPPSKKDSAARTIGKRLNKRAAAKPDELLTTTPKKVGTSPRRKPNPLAVWHPEGSRSLARMARKRRASREPTLKPTHAMSVIGKKRRKGQAESGGK